MHRAIIWGLDTACECGQGQSRRGAGEATAGGVAHGLGWGVEGRRDGLGRGEVTRRASSKRLVCLTLKEKAVAEGGWKRDQEEATAVSGEDRSGGLGQGGHRGMEKR